MAKEKEKIVEDEDGNEVRPDRFVEDDGAAFAPVEPDDEAAEDATDDGDDDE